MLIIFASRIHTLQHSAPKQLMAHCELVKSELSPGEHSLAFLLISQLERLSNIQPGVFVLAVQAVTARRAVPCWHPPVHHLPDVCACMHTTLRISSHGQYIVLSHCIQHGQTGLLLLLLKCHSTIRGWKKRSELSPGSSQMKQMSMYCVEHYCTHPSCHITQSEVHAQMHKLWMVQ